jgi:hypothetical protein
MIIKFVLLAVLIRLLLATDKPFLCSGIYAGVALLLGLIFGNPFLAVLIHAAISFLLASLYFWLLDKLEGSEVLWWLVAIVGILIGLV